MPDILQYPWWQKDSTVNQQLHHIYIFIDYFNRSYSRLFSSQLKTSAFIHFTRQHSSSDYVLASSLIPVGCVLPTCHCTGGLSLSGGRLIVQRPPRQTLLTETPPRNMRPGTDSPRRNVGPVNQTGSEIRDPLPLWTDRHL